MKKNKKNIFLLLAIIIFTIVLYNRTIDAQTVDPLPNIGNIPLRPLSSVTPPKEIFLGGRIVSLKAPEIGTQESSGFTCEVPGETIQIRERGVENSYIILHGITSITKNPINTKQHILAWKKGTVTIDCKKCYEEDRGLLRKDQTHCLYTTVTLPSISRFGNSRI